MTQITTSGGLITFQDTVTGLTKQIGQNRLWLMFKADTVNFLQVDVPTDGYDGTPFWACRASNLTINGETYTIEQLKNGEGLDGMFSSMSFNVEIVEELPDAGDPSTIYLIYDDETGTYTEYLWLAQEQVYEELGSVADVDLGNYYTKTQVDQLLAVKANLSALATVATSGSYNDLTDKPVIPTVPTNVSAFTNDAGYLTEHQSLANYYNKSQTDNLLNGKVNTGSLATVATSGSYNDLSDKPDLSTKQDTLVSGVNIKTINSQSLLGEGNIVIEGGGGGGTQVQSNWAETDTTSMAFIQNKPTNVSSFVNDAGYLTQHQSLADVFADVAYDSANTRINFYGKGDTQHTNVLAYVDASDFVVDGMIEDVRIENGNLVIDFNTDSGITDITIPLTDIFDPSNYYTKTEVDTALATKANSSSLATVATSGSYNDLSDKPTIAGQVNADWNASSGVAQILNKPTLATVATSGSYSDLSDKPTIDSALSDQSTNAVQNAVVTGAIQQAISQTTKGFDEQARYFSVPLQKGQNLVAGTNITLTPTSTTMTGQLWDEQTQQWVDTTYNVTGVEISASGGGSAQVQSDWNQTDTTAVDFIKNKPTIPTTITVDNALSSTSENPVQNKVIYAVVGQIEQALIAINGSSQS